MLDSLITSQTRIKLLLRFFMNPKMRGYLRQLASDFGESTNSIRVELNKLSEAKILTSRMEGRNKVYQANLDHPLFNKIRNIVLKSTGITQVVSNILEKLGDVRTAFIRGDYAVGNDSGLIDLVLVGDRPEAGDRVRLRERSRQIVAALGTDLGGDGTVDQVVERRGADRCEHLGEVVGGGADVPSHEIVGRVEIPEWCVGHGQTPRSGTSLRSPHLSG